MAASQKFWVLLVIIGNSAIAEFRGKLRDGCPMIMYRMLLAIIGLALFSAAYADDNRPRNLSAPCFACHGTDGNSEGGMPVLAGMDKALFVSQMSDFKSGARPATVMHQHARGYTDEEIKLMAGFFEAQKRK